jgi:hypothetical protein
MKTSYVLILVSIPFLISGCTSSSPGRSGGTVPYQVAIEASDPGSRVELDGEYMGVTPLTITIWGDSDGTFHGAGNGYTIIKAYPVRPGQYPQTKSFLNGAQQFMFGQQDQIPKRLYFDLNQKPEGVEIRVSP